MFGFYANNYRVDSINNINILVGYKYDIAHMINRSSFVTFLPNVDMNIRIVAIEHNNYVRYVAYYGKAVIATWHDTIYDYVHGINGLYREIHDAMVWFDSAVSTGLITYDDYSDYSFAAFMLADMCKSIVA